jgi:hypothetical protein
MLVFNKYFYKNEKSKLCFGDRVVVLNDFFYQTEGSRPISLTHSIAKIFSKLLAHRLSRELNKIVSRAQSALSVSAAFTTTSYIHRTISECCTDPNNLDFFSSWT